MEKEFEYIIKKVVNSSDYSDFISLFQEMIKDKTDIIINEPNADNLYLHKIELAHYKQIINGLESYHQQYKNNV